MELRRKHAGEICPEGGLTRRASRRGLARERRTPRTEMRLRGPPHHAKAEASGQRLLRSLFTRDLQGRGRVSCFVRPEREGRRGGHHEQVGLIGRASPGVLHAELGVRLRRVVVHHSVRKVVRAGRALLRVRERDALLQGRKVDDHFLRRVARGKQVKEPVTASSLPSRRERADSRRRGLGPGARNLTRRATLRAEGDLRRRTGHIPGDPPRVGLRLGANHLAVPRPARGRAGRAINRAVAARASSPVVREAGRVS